MGSFELSDRSRRLLATLVREYIETGEPVASQVLARKSGLGVSSATVRNVLAQLEEAGLRAPAAHLGRPRADRSRLPRRSSISCSRAVARPVRRPMSSSSSGSAPARRRSWTTCWPACRTSCRAPRGTSALRSPSTPVAVLQRIEFVAARRLPGAGGRRLARQSGDAEGGGRAARTSVRTTWSQAANYLNTEFAGPAAARGARRGAATAAPGTHALRPAAGARAAPGAASRSKSCRASRRSTSKGVASLLDEHGARRRLAGHAARAARDDGREGADGSSAQPVHRRPGPDGGDRRRAHVAWICARSA